MNGKCVKLIECLLLLILLAGCSSTHIIRTGEELTINDKATFVMRDDTKIFVDRLHARQDSVFAMDIRADQSYSFHRSEIKKLVDLNRGKGAGRGLAIGVGGGALFGYLAGDDNSSDAMGSRGAGAFILGSMGLMFGPVVGGILGYKERYIFEYDSAKTVLPAELETVSVEKSKVKTPVVKAVERSETKPVDDPAQKKYETIQVRQKWYFGANIGFGNGNLKEIDQEFVSRSSNSGSGYGFNYELGRTINEKTLIGIHAGAFGYTEDNVDKFDIGKINLALTYFPNSRGLFYKGELGYCNYLYKRQNASDPSDVLYEDEKSGIGADLGAGYAFWHGRRFNTLISGAFKMNFFNGEDLQHWTQLSIGFMWY